MLTHQRTFRKSADIVHQKIQSSGIIGAKNKSGIFFSFFVCWSCNTEATIVLTQTYFMRVATFDQCRVYVWHRRAARISFTNRSSPVATYIYCGFVVLKSIQQLLAGVILTSQQQQNPAALLMCVYDFLTSSFPPRVYHHYTTPPVVFVISRMRLYIYVRFYELNQHHA